MANPQKENGYGPIANEIMEALAKTNLSPYESRVLWMVLRHTYGFQRKTDRLSLSQISKGTGLDRGNAGRAERTLLMRNILCKMGDGSIGFQKDYEKWGVSHKTLVSAETQCLLRPQNGVSVDRKSEVSRDTTIDIKKKDIWRGLPGVTSIQPNHRKTPGVNGLNGFKETMNLFSALFIAKCGAKPDIDGGRDGKILSGLLKRHGAEEVQAVMRFFFENPPPWVEAQGRFTIMTFKFCYSEMLVLRRRQVDTFKSNHRREMPA